MKAAGVELLKHLRAVAPDSWNGKTRTISFRDGKVVVMNEPEVHKKIRSLLASLRTSMGTQIAVLCRFIVRDSSVLDKTGAKWQDLKTDGVDKQRRRLPPPGPIKAGETVGAAEATKVRRLPVKWAMLDSVPDALTVLMIPSGCVGNIPTSPRFVCFQSQRQSCSWIIGRYVHADEPEGKRYAAVLKFVGAPQGKSAIRTSLSFEMSRPVVKGKIISVDGKEKPDQTDKGYDAVVHRIRLLTTIPDGKTLALRCPLSEWAFGEEEKKGWKFWKSEKKREVIILVTVHIIQQDED
jgi:hypothetical protein